MRRYCGGSRSRLNVALGDCPFEDQMKLDIWKRAQIATILIIRYFIET